MKKKIITITTKNKLNIDNESDDIYALSYIIEEEDGASRNISSWHPINSDKNGMYDIVEYYVYTENDVCLEIKSVLKELPEMKFIYMNGVDFAAYMNENTQKIYIFKVTKDGININNINFKSKNEILKFIQEKF